MLKSGDISFDFGFEWPPPWTDEVRLSLSMHELSLSMPEPMLSLIMLILATYPVAALDGTIRTQNENWHL